MGEYIVKKYENRKLYDIQKKKYINLYGISKLIREGTEVKVIDNKNKEDITSLILAQIIVEQEKTKKVMLPSVLFPLDLLKKSGKSVIDFSKKIILAGMGTLSLTGEKATKIADELVKRGELSKEDSKEFIVDLLNKAEQGKEKLVEKIKPEIKYRLEKMSFVSKKYVDDLEKKVQELEERIEYLSNSVKPNK